MIQTKICGLSTPEAVDAALQGGAAYLGFVFFAPSPRNLDPSTAAALARPARARGARIVAVTVDAGDAELDGIAQALAPDFIQLHGGETPTRAAEVKRRTGASVIKALKVGDPADLQAAAAFAETADQLLFDAKPPARQPGEAMLPGGNGLAFDWTMLSGLRLVRPWFVAGGLDAGNVAEAVRTSGAAQVDVSSGVETAPGCKDPRLITAFLDAVRCASA